MIPRILHQVWLGKENPPPYEWMETFKNIYKDWEYKLWTEDNLPELVNQDIYDTETRNHTKSNLIRYEVVYKYGGVYFDADMVCLKKFEDFGEFTTAFESEKYVGGLIPSCFFASIPKHPILEKLVYEMKNQDQNKPSWKFNGTQFFTDKINEYQGEKTILPSWTVQPVHFRDTEMTDEIKERLSKAYVDHKWGTSKRIWKTDKR